MDDLFPIENLFHPLDPPVEDKSDLIRERIASIATDPLSHSQLNQLMHLSHQAGMTEGFFAYYFLTRPETHPFLVPEPPHVLSDEKIISEAQLRWGLERFALDAAFFFGDFTNAYRTLRDLSFDEIVGRFHDWKKDADSLRVRGPVMQMQDIAIEDRHLISEEACKTMEASGIDAVSSQLEAALASVTELPVTIEALVRIAGKVPADQPLSTSLALVLHDSFQERVSSSDDIARLVDALRTRWQEVHEKALLNTDHYLSLCPELDVYVATSMRAPQDFRETGEVCERIFNATELEGLYLRWFDPTKSACRGHEDKGLVECLMVALAQAVLYFAGTRATWGKDAEAAMALSRGTPVIILCPDTPEGRATARTFRDVHPLSRLTDVRFGVAVGAIVTTDESQVPILLRRLFSGEMEYRLERRDNRGFVVREVLTDSAVRTVTADRMIRETFWNYYSKNYAALQ